MGRVEAVPGSLLQTAAHEARDARRDSPARRGHLGRVLLQDRVHRLDRAVASKCARAREHLVQQRPEGEDVRAVVHRLAPYLLGRHEAHGPQHHPRFRGPGTGALVSFADERRRARQLGEAEVEDLDPAVVRDEDVVRLEVAVNDPLVVSSGEATSDLERVVEGLATEGSALEAYPQGVALEQLRDDVGRAVVRADIVDGEDVGWSGRRRRGPLLEAAELLAIGDLLGENLDRDFALQAGVAGAVDLAHPPRAEQPHGLVRAESRAGLERHRCTPAPRTFSFPRTDYRVGGAKYSR